MLVSVFHLHSALDCLNKTISVARAAGTLIPKAASEVVSVDVSQVKLMWHFVIRNVIWSPIVVSEFLRLVSYCLEILSLLGELLLSRLRILCESFLCTFISLVVICIELVQYGSKRLFGHVVRVRLLFYIWLHFQSLL